MNCSCDGGGGLLERVKTTMLRLLKNLLFCCCHDRFISELSAFKITWLQARDRYYCWRASFKAPAKVITMNVSRRNSKEVFELFTNKLSFFLEFCKDEVAWLVFREKLIFLDYKEFLFSICFISLSSNLKLSIDIFIRLHVRQSVLKLPLSTQSIRYSAHLSRFNV